MISERRETLARQKQVDAKAPKTGDLAPDFELSDSDGQHPVRLSDFRGQKPVALLFGSYT
jgi:peroxiredoxin